MSNSFSVMNIFCYCKVIISMPSTIAAVNRKKDTRRQRNVCEWMEYIFLLSLASQRLQHFLFECFTTLSERWYSFVRLQIEMVEALNHFSWFRFWEKIAWKRFNPETQSHTLWARINYKWILSMRIHERTKRDQMHRTGQCIRQLLMWSTWYAWAC